MAYILGQIPMGTTPKFLQAGYEKSVIARL
jgi:hypothetical protein